MRNERDEDLFRDTTMTFGEHLEELRVALWRAVIGLIAGFLIGLFFGNYVVAFIQSPLTAALKDYYQKRSELKTEEILQERETKAGHVLTADRDRVKQRIASGYLPTIYYAEPTSARADRARPATAAPKPVADNDKTGDGPDLEAPVIKDAEGEIRPAGQTSVEPEEAALEPVIFYQRAEEDPRLRPTTLNAHEAFSIWMKASLLLGILLASPWIFYQLWMFVAAGLYPHEKRYVHVFLPFSLGLFLAGAALAFFFVFEPVLQFLLEFNEWLHMDPDIRISEWLSFVLILPLGFGISFQLPLVMLFLERIGIFSVESYLAKWRIAVLVIFVVAMVLTPSDPYSMLFMAVPLTFLYFGGVGLCRLMPKKRSPYAVAAD